ncbi:GYD domain-containing protein [Thermoflexus sp.]|uniref:GYD domain-containing protein n=1 Tax=Thermoflexus sp. TaxID=1969742 RepID=UPI0025D6C4DB|nr:GYD domain-containing protein [Thermoflexus sp.]MDW8179399.1 GYD domain-containing protein [Anaerolineae bacterium]MCS6964366.1 GYD domain-containing protein [Thermoflexus sp.]MCS7349951.1 GYD domain-containing protein [Thermoflexus sp.]MCX7689651.1 GYD domain-containing protein [Thermoflexus sp.]MDW8185636.1 GYD domain-containing protein [Anaerolineae bacterium]
MAIYIMLSTLTGDGAETIRERPERILEVNREVEAMGVKVLAQYAVLGPYDFVNIVEAPDNETVARVSVELASRGSVKIMTLPAIPIEEFIRRIKG